MKISLIQSDLHWANKQKNFAHFEQRLTVLKGKTDLAVLPEMFSTGFIVDKPEFAEEMDSETVFLIKKWAKNFGFAIAGSFFAKENSKLYNRAFFATPDGAFLFADKRHTFSLAGENRFITKGDKKLIANYLGINICVLVCYDIRFPVWARNVNNEYDLLIFVANFPDKRIDVWDTLLPARAIENQAFVCGVNRVGTDSDGFTYKGRSAIFDFTGKLLVRCHNNAETTVTTEINISDLQHFRTKFCFWKDGDRFEIK